MTVLYIHWTVVVVTGGVVGQSGGNSKQKPVKTSGTVPGGQLHSFKSSFSKQLKYILKAKITFNSIIILCNCCNYGGPYSVRSSILENWLISSDSCGGFPA